MQLAVAWPSRQQLYLAVPVCLMFLAVAQWRLKNNQINYFNHDNYVPVKYWIFVRHCQNRILIHTNFSVEHTSCDVECEGGGGGGFHAAQLWVCVSCMCVFIIPVCIRCARVKCLHKCVNVHLACERLCVMN